MSDVSLERFPKKMMRLAEAMEAADGEMRADSDHAPDSIPRFTLEQNGME